MCRDIDERNEDVSQLASGSVYGNVGKSLASRADYQSYSIFGGQAQLIELSEHKDERGALIPLDFSKMPFQPCRAFVINDVPAGTTRGRHAHKHGLQFLIRLTGRLLITLRYNGEEQTCVLERSDLGLLVGPGVWSKQTYAEPDTTLLVFASAPYDPASYVIDPT